MGSEGWLSKYRTFEVEVHYLSDSSHFKDRGRLSDFGDGWIELTKTGEIFIIPASAIRLIKIVSEPVQGGRALLRPAIPEEGAEVRQTESMEQRVGCG